MSEGQPPYFDTPEQLQEAIDAYFDSLIGVEKNPTITGLCYALGFASRQSFYDYEKREEFSYTIKRARLRIEQFYEEALMGNRGTGAIFALKNFGWTDRQEIDHTSKGESLTGFTVKIQHESNGQTQP